MDINELAEFYMPGNIVLFMVIFWFFVVWCLIWKGIALWKAARNESKPWFVVLLILNTLGILEILYAFIFSKKKK